MKAARWMVSWLAAFALSAAVGQVNELHVAHLVERVGENKLNTTLFLEGPPEALDQVRCVEYFLGQTFPDPIRKVCERGQDGRAFAVPVESWGGFSVQIMVYLTNGQVVRLSHQVTP